MGEIAVGPMSVSTDIRIIAIEQMINSGDARYLNCRIGISESSKYVRLFYQRTEIVSAMSRYDFTRESGQESALRHYNGMTNKIPTRVRIKWTPGGATAPIMTLLSNPDQRPTERWLFMHEFATNVSLKQIQQDRTRRWCYNIPLQEGEETRVTLTLTYPNEPIIFYAVGVEFATVISDKVEIMSLSEIRQRGIRLKPGY